MGTIKQFVTELCPSYLGTFQLFTVSLHFLRRGCTYWNIHPREGDISVPQTSLVSTWFGLPNGGKNIAYIIVTYLTFPCIIGKPRYNLLPPPHHPTPTPDPKKNELTKELHFRLTRIWMQNDIYVNVSWNISLVLAFSWTNLMYMYLNICSLFMAF